MEMFLVSCDDDISKTHPFGHVRSIHYSYQSACIFFALGILVALNFRTGKKA